MLRKRVMLSAHRFIAKGFKMNKPTKAENKRIKHWERVSAASPSPKSSAKSTAVTDGLTKPLNSEVAPSTVTKQKAEQNASLREWDNEGGTASTGAATPKT